MLDIAANELFEQLYPETALPHQIQVSIQRSLKIEKFSCALGSYIWC